MKSPLGRVFSSKATTIEPSRLDFLVHKFHYVDPPHLLFVPKALSQTLELPKPESHLLIEAILPAISHNRGYVSDMPYVCFYWDFRLHRNPHLLITCPRSTFTFLFSTSTIAWNKVYKNYLSWFFRSCLVHFKMQLISDQAGTKTFMPCEDPSEGMT